MKHNELLKELEKRMSRYGYCETWTHMKVFIAEYESLTKDEKSIRLKDVIKRIKGFDNGTKFKWTYDILKELGSDFASKIFHEGYQQGRFDEAVETHHEPEKVKIPQSVADWIEHFKKCSGTLYGSTAPYSYYGRAITDGFEGDVTEVLRWIHDNSEVYARAWLDCYEVEKEKRYRVEIKGICVNHETLNREKHSNKWLFSDHEENSLYDTKHTRKELEDAGFGWVFDCEGIEIKEVTE